MSEQDIVSADNIEYILRRLDELRDHVPTEYCLATVVRAADIIEALRKERDELYEQCWLPLKSRSIYWELREQLGEAESLAERYRKAIEDAPCDVPICVYKCWLISARDAEALPICWKRATLNQGE